MKRAAINASGASSEPLGLEAMREALESILVLCADYAGASSVDISVLKEISALASLQLPEAEIQPDWKQDQAETSRLPRVKSLTGSEDMDCVFNPHRYAEPSPSEANSTAAPVGELSGPVQSWGVTVTINGIDALTIESACLSGAPNIDEYREAVENCARHLLAFAGRPDAVPEPVAFMFWNEPDTQRHFSQIRETIGNHWTKIAPLYTVPPAPVDAGVREALEDCREYFTGKRRPELMMGMGHPHQPKLIAKIDRALAALSSQPVVGVDQEESHGRKPEPKQNI